MLRKKRKKIWTLRPYTLPSSRGMDNPRPVIYYQRNCSGDKTREIAMANLFSRQKTQPLDRRQSLDSVPVLNEDVSSREGDAARVSIAIRQRRRSGFMGRFRALKNTVTRTSFATGRL